MKQRMGAQMYVFEWHLRFFLRHSKMIFLKKIGLYEWYVSENLKRRVGKCTACGHCCFRMKRQKRCPHYDEKTRLCKIYLSKEYDKRRCADFPIDEEDCRLLNCYAYRWKK